MATPESTATATGPDGEPRGSEPRWQRITDYFIPPRIRAEPDACRRARILVGFAAVPAPVSVLVSFAYRASLSPEAAPFLINMVWLAMVVSLATPWALRWTGSLTVPINVLAGYCYLLFATISALTGGTTSAGIFWNAVIPLCVMAIGGLRIATFWFAACVAQYAAFFALEVHGVEIPNYAPGDRRRLLWLNSISNLTLIAFSIVVLYERAKNAALRTLERANAELARARDAADAANRSKTEFLANISHEIRTPMTAILGYTDVLRTDGDRGADAHRDAVETIQRNSHHLLDIINDLLDLSKIEAGKLDVERIPFDPGGLVAEVVDLMRVRADARRLGLAVEFATAIPERISGDPMRLKQVLTNLVGNAIKFTDVGGVRVVARLANRGGEMRIQFEVTDTGIGIAADKLRSLFEPFIQADSSTTRQYGGTGLGLAICKRLCDLMGGGIAVESDEGAGTTFRVDLPTGPLDGVRMLRDAAARETAPAAAGAARELRGRVLIAEDGADNQRLFAHFLTAAGAEVAIAENGRVALERVEAAEDEGAGFDVVLLDMQMPVMDGYSAARALRERGCQIPIVALTAHAMPGERDKCLRAGCNDFATKPIERAHLLDTVARHLGRAKPPA